MADFQNALSYVLEICIADLNSLKITIKINLGGKADESDCCASLAT